MLKIWGRNTSSNVQKVMWALAELGLPCERLDVGGAFGKTRDGFYLKMNPNSLVPTLEEEDGFTMWESNSIVRYLGAKHGAGTLEPADLRERARAQMWMDWQLSVMGPAITPVFWQTDSHTRRQARCQCRSLPARKSRSRQRRSWTRSSAAPPIWRATRSPMATFPAP